jgi:hypothetical protein
MNTRWLFLSTLIALGGVGAGVGAFGIASVFVPDRLLQLTAGFLTVVAVDVALVILFYRRLARMRPGEENKE